MTTAGGTNGNGAALNGPLDPKTFARFENLVANVLSLRQQWMRSLSDPRRNIEVECGYPKIDEEINPALYQQQYERNAIAARVVEVLPRECWQVQSLVYEEEDPDTVTAFEEGWDSLGKQLRGERSWYQEEQGSALWEYLKRADELSGIGQYGVIFFGLDDGLDLSQPARGVTEINSLPRGMVRDNTLPVPSINGPYRLVTNAAETAGRKLLFLRVFPESAATITQLEGNWTSPRFGQPLEYEIVFDGTSQQSSAPGVSLSSSTRRVHWTRAQHVSESGEVFSPPRMRAVLNQLLGLYKILCASPEAFWKGCLNLLAIESDPSLGGDVLYDKADLRDQIESLQNSLQNWIALNGFSAKSIAPTVTDPTPHALMQIEAICIKLGVPKRIFMGSERGELASSQDDAAWNDRLKERQKNYVTPKLIVPFVDRLIWLGILPEPKQGYCVSWPDLTSQSDAEKATVANTRTTALATYVSGGVEALVPPMDYLTRILGFTEEEATAILDNAESAASDTLTIPPKGDAGHPASVPPAVVPARGSDTAPAAPPTSNAFDSDEQRRAFFGLLKGAGKLSGKSAKDPLNPTEDNRKITPVGDAHKQETTMGTKTISKSGTMRNVDAYQPGSLIKHEGEWHVVAGHSVRTNDHGGYEHTLTLRPANEDEQRRGKIGDVKAELRAMGAGPSDDRDRPAHDARANELRAELARLEAPDKERAAKEVLTAPPAKRFIAAVAAVKARPEVGNRGDIADALGIEWERFLDLEDGNAHPTTDELAKIDAVLRGGK